MGSIRIPRDELMSYTMGTFNAILRNMQTEKEVKPEFTQSGSPDFASMQKEYLDSLSPSELKALKVKHGVR